MYLGIQVVYQLTIDNENREEKILSYIKDNQGCNKQAVDNYATEKGISTRRTTMRIIKDLEDRDIIYTRQLKPNSRDIRLYLNRKKLIGQLHFEVKDLLRSFDLIVEEILKDKDTSNLNAPNTEYNVKVKINSLLSCVLKLITSLLNEILVYSLSEVEDKERLGKEYHYFYAKIAEIHISFDRLKEMLDETSLEYIPIFSKRNDSYFKTFLWSLMIFYETRDYPHYFLYSKNFKSNLFSLMNLVYNLGRKYVNTFYDEIVCDASTYNNEFLGFPSARYTRHMREELKKLDYSKFVILLIERCLSIESLKSSSAGILLNEIELELSKRNPILDPDKHISGIFEKAVDNVIESLYQNNPHMSYNATV